MSEVKRCDNPQCTEGKDGGVKIAQSAQETGWLTVTLVVDSGASATYDYSSPECAAQALLSARSSTATVSAAAIHTDPVVEAPTLVTTPPTV